MQPAAAQRLLGLLGAPPVAAHDERGATQISPTSPAGTSASVVVEDPDLHPGNRLADRAGPTVPGTRRRDERGRLGQAVALADLRARQATRELVHDFGGERRGAGRDVAELAQVVLLQRLREQQVQHRRHHRDDLAAVLLRELEPALGVEPAHQHVPARLGRVQADARDEQPERVRERKRREAPDDPRHVARVLGDLAAQPEVLVREHHALRAAGRAAGVHQRREVVVGAFDDRRLAARLQLTELLGRDDARGGCRLACGVGELGRRDHDACLGVVDDVPELRRREQKDRGRDHGAGAPERVVGDPDLGAVRHQHDDAVARLDPRVAKTLGETARPLVHSRRSVPLAFEEERLVVAVPLERLLGEPSEVVLSQRASSVRRPCPSARPSSRATRRRGSARAAARGSRPHPSRSRRRRARPTPTAGAC